jgi:deoxyribodipyrimidine photo-lyase
VAAVLWFRRDLRLGDQPALLAAREASPQGIVGLFVLDDALRRPSGAARLAFLYRCLRDLDEQLGGRLVVRRGDPVKVVAAVAREADAQTVHISADYGPYGAERDKRVEAALEDDGRQLVRTGSPYAVAPGRVVNGEGSAYRVFTPFSKAWRAHGWREPASRPRALDWLQLDGTGIPKDPGVDGKTLPDPGEQAAHDRLAAFLPTVAGYAKDRNLPANEATSRLSPYLKYGCIHPRTVLSQLAKVRAKGGGGSDSKGFDTFENELAWREFYADVLWQHPASARSDLTAALEGMDYADVSSGAGAERFEAWKQGRTGFPIVDAGMRQLLAEGWMHNRVRMIAASFLVKDLHVWWPLGARWFLDQLVDGDLASNNHGWQWVAGTGTDAAPYFRVFNPSLQGAKFDPDGEYVRRYVPELREGGSGYPAPIVDHAQERETALSRYSEARAEGSR